MKRRRIFLLVLWTGLTVSAALWTLARRENGVLRSERVRLQEAVAARAETVVSKRASAAKPDAPPQTEREIDGSAMLRNLAVSAGEITFQQNGAISRGIQSKINHHLEVLSPEELTALILTYKEPGFLFASEPAGQLSPQVILETTIRLLALENLAVADPMAALRLMEEPLRQSRPARTTGAGILTSKILNLLAEEDSEAALEWTLRQRGHLPESETYSCAVLEVLARTDMTAAWELARRRGLTNLPRLPDHLAHSAGSREDADVFMTGLSKVESPAEDGETAPPMARYGDLFLQKLGNAGGFEAARAFAEKWASGQPWSVQAAVTAARSAFSRVPDAAGPAAADWAVNFTPEKRRAETAESLVGAWAEEDFTGPALWLKQSPPAPWRDHGYAALCRKLRPFDPEAAREWAANITDTELRDAILAEMGN